MSASSEAAAQSWPSEVREFVQEEQERAYRNLGLKLRLGANAAKTFAHVSQPQMSLSHVSWKKWAEFGVESTPEEEKTLELSVQTYLGRYFTEPPTPYEDRNQYPVMAMILDEVLGAFSAVGLEFDPKPVVATRPSGKVNAEIVVEKKTRTPIIFIERGLFDFLYDFALGIGEALPAFSAAELGDDLALSRHRGPHTLPLGGGPFSEVLREYVVAGTTNRKSVPKPTHNRALSECLVNQMSRFVIAHELSHYALGHLDEEDQRKAWAKEYQADSYALFVLSQLAHSSGQSQGFIFWASDICLLCLDLLDRAIGLLAFGSSPGWVSPTHPDAFSRSRRLREILELGHITQSARRVVVHYLKCIAAWLGFGSAPNFELSLSSLNQQELLLVAQSTVTAHAAAAELGGMSYSIVAKLWEFNSLFLALAYQKGERPSPIWSVRIASSFKLQ